MFILGLLCGVTLMVIISFSAYFVNRMSEKKIKKSWDNGYNEGYELGKRHSKFIHDEA